MNMTPNEALQKIEEIDLVLKSTNRAAFSGERMMVIGVLIALIPLIELSTQYLTFGHDVGEHATLIVTLIHTLFYWSLFGGIGRLLPFKKLDRSTLHPQIQKAFAVSKPFLVACYGTIFVFASIHQGQFIHPIIFLLLGMIFSIYGKYSIPQVSAVAWSYIAAGLLYAYLTQFEGHGYWIYFTVYQGLSFIFMGYFFRQGRKNSE